VSFIVCVALCSVFCLAWCVNLCDICIFVCCLIVGPLPLGYNPSVAQLNNNNNMERHNLSVVGCVHFTHFVQLMRSMAA
jgi:hypothetical protein